MKYISYGTAYNTIDAHVPAPLFKRVFDGGEAAGATLVIAAVGLYRLWLNGRELNKSLFAPYMSNPDQAVFSDTYPLDGLLHKSGNVLCVLLGNGFANCNDSDIWGNSSAPYRAAPKFALHITAADGRTLLETDEDFRATESPITFDDFRCGEHYDARRERAGILSSLSLDGFEKITIAPPPRGAILDNTAQPVTVHGERRAVSVTRTERGYLYDFGINDTGIWRLTLDGRAGQMLDLYFGEVLEGDRLDLRNISFEASREGYVQHDRYICREGHQTHRPSFTWHGFRYCEVVGMTEGQGTADALVMLPTHSALPQVCRFSCDHETVSRIAAMTKQSDVSNFIFYPYDCPQREKNGWTADASLSAEQMLLTYDALPSFRQWLHTVRLAQRPDGALPETLWQLSDTLTVMLYGGGAVGWYDAAAGIQWYCVAWDGGAPLVTAFALMDAQSYTVPTAPSGAETQGYDLFDLDGMTVTEVTFTLDGRTWRYRMAPTMDVTETIPDISGAAGGSLTAEGTVRWCVTALRWDEGGAGCVIWKDVAPGLVYSLTVDTGASETLLSDTALLVFQPAQEES